MGTAITVEIDEQGRMTVPKPARQALGIDGEEAIAEVEIDVKRKVEQA